MRSNVGSPHYSSQPGWLVPGGRFAPLYALTPGVLGTVWEPASWAESAWAENSWAEAVGVSRPARAVCVRGGDHRRVSVAGAGNRVSVRGADHRRVGVTFAEQTC